MTNSVPQIRTIPDPILEQPTTAVSGAMWDRIMDVSRDLLTAMAAYPAVGFAANQLGHDFRMFVMVREDDSYQVFINPKIVFASPQKMEDWEGCMSIPDKQALVSRSLKIMVSTENGRTLKKRVFTLRDYEARIAQHEIDHLDGITILDRAVKVEDIVRDPA